MVLSPKIASYTSRSRHIHPLTACLWLVCLVLAAPVSANAAPGSLDPTSVPPSWIQFSKLLKYRLEEELAAGDAIAARFRIYLWAQAGASDGPPSSLIVQVWVNPNGAVRSVAFPPFGDRAATKDLTALLTRCNVGEPPPPDMLQPVRLRFNLTLKSTDKPPVLGR